MSYAVLRILEPALPVAEAWSREPLAEIIPRVVNQLSVYNKSGSLTENLIFFILVQ